AEDGIRDFHVTGVQTCALPIWPMSSAETGQTSTTTSVGLLILSFPPLCFRVAHWPLWRFSSVGLRGLSIPQCGQPGRPTTSAHRSEERRVANAAPTRLRRRAAL